MDKSMKKRNVPPLIEKVLAIDVYLTNLLVKWIEQFLAFRQLRTHYRLLEISCHGLIWLPCWIGFVWILSSQNLYQMQVNFFIGLILDIIVVATLKAVTRRRRPAATVSNSSSFDIGPDKFSFPSGHASRASYIASFFLFNWPVHFIFVPPLLCWASSVCISRILAKRHHLLDIVVGAFLGFVESCFIGLIYLEKDTCTNIISWLTDEKLDGGEYHV
ncbi:phospholipid phosphatase 6 [Copidosoma floridanum]|uniref:phospholipid phosphatase 6 n=1 Tax=Copidosoma floridanum TaxID=29053 RepID=UPI0006C9D8D7|nr:phospholipid phosphatase 6 [Copidosoma floridanum]